MTESDSKFSNLPRPYPVAALLISLVGLIDAAYLTANHIAGTAVPCNLVNGCEMVLNSQWAEIYGIPTAVFGAIAYFTVFSTALLVYFGTSFLWKIYGAIATMMFLFSLWLVYLQAFVINAFCQYCLVSAATSSLLFIVFAVSVVRHPRR